MDTIVILFGGILMFGAGFSYGRVKGYTDSLPARGPNGRFKKKD